MNPLSHITESRHQAVEAGNQNECSTVSSKENCEPPRINGLLATVYADGTDGESVVTLGDFDVAPEQFAPP
jgi:hypothetical protein